MPRSHEQHAHSANEDKEEPEERVLYVLTKNLHGDLQAVDLYSSREMHMRRGFIGWEYEEIIEQPLLPMVPVTSFPILSQPPSDLAVLSPHTSVATHRLLAYRPSSATTGPLIHWDVSLHPSTAILSPFLPVEDGTEWARMPAFEPHTVSNIAICITGVRRPVVVSPVRLGSYVRIVDIFETVYDALRASAVSNGHSAQVAAPTFHGNNTSANELTANAICQYLNMRIWWGGLYLSDNPDVWVLQTYKTSRGRGWY